MAGRDAGYRLPATGTGHAPRPRGGGDSYDAAILAEGYRLNNILRGIFSKNDEIDLIIFFRSYKFSVIHHNDRFRA